MSVTLQTVRHMRLCHRCPMHLRRCEIPARLNPYVKGPLNPDHRRYFTLKCGEFRSAPAVTWAQPVSRWSLLTLTATHSYATLTSRDSTAEPFYTFRAQLDKSGVCFTSTRSRQPGEALQRLTHKRKKERRNSHQPDRRLIVFSYGCLREIKASLWCSLAVGSVLR